jgi:uncharacterized protein with PIN domain
VCEFEWRCIYCGSLLLKTVKKVVVLDRFDTDFGLRGYEFEVKCKKCSRYNWAKNDKSLMNTKKENF